MNLHQQISALRKSKGLTQEELASRTQLTVRTIQRIESGESVPRSFTLKAIAQALDTPFEYFNTVDTKPAGTTNSTITIDQGDAIHKLQMINLSCFSYIGIPYVHFLIPGRILKKSTGLSPQMIDTGQRIVRQQVYWVVALNLLMLLTLAYNIFMKAVLHTTHFIHYLIPFFVMYFFNACLIGYNAVRIKRMDWQTA